MLRNFIILSICVCCVLSVFGLDGNWTYDGLKGAVESVSDETYFLQTNFNKVSLLCDILPIRFTFNPDVDYIEMYTWSNTATGEHAIEFTKAKKLRDGKCLITTSDGYSEYDCEATYDPDMPTLYNSERTTYIFNSKSDRDKVYNDLKYLISVPHYSDDNPFSALLNAMCSLLYFVSILFVIIETLIFFIVDFVVLVFSLVGACVRLIFA